ncbi:MAG: hypothetical protein FD147_2537 [Chloroflexi bacterium]|nr:MAG: hypothetical protein FD147_2537 [Chloroflexota bacterium]
MDTEIIDIRKHTIEKILTKQDDSFRWGFDEKQARERPEYLHYSPNFKSTLWTLLLLADIKAPVDIPQIKPPIRLITEHFYNPAHGIFSLPDMCRFPIPCLNGNMIYLHHYFKTSHSEILDKTIGFFAAYQRFDDGDFKTPKSYPYCSNTFCNGKHTCYWGVTKLLKGISFIPKIQRTKEAQQLIENCIDFVLHHEVCFRSHNRDEFLHRDIGKLTFPNFYKSDFLEILWLLAREEVRNGRMSRALALLRSRMKDGGFWELEKSMNIIVSIGQKDCANAFITERATEVLDYYGH